jgi:hypothetical protein
MKRIVIPQNLTGKDLFKFLVDNKQALIATKKSDFKRSEPVHYNTSIISAIKDSATKAAGDAASMPEDNGRLDVKVVANTAWWCDSAMDVLTDKCYDKSIKEKGNLIPHIADHIHRSTSHVGDVKSVYTQKVAIKDLGYDAAGDTTALIFETTVREDYNPDTYKFYKNGKINQHSIGLIYLSIGLCINDKECLAEFELWKKYYDKVINKEVVDERGYFWIVTEIKLIENSCVLFGCNELTPTIDIADTADQPEGDSTDKSQPSQEQKQEPETVSKQVDWNKIASSFI